MCDPMTIALFAFKQMGTIGEARQTASAVKQRVGRAGEILANAKDEMNQLAKAQERRLGTQRAAYGKQGVKLAGTAQRLEFEQIAQNERDLLSIKWNADLEARAEVNEAKKIRKAGQKAFVKGTIGNIGQENIESVVGDAFNYLGLGK